MKTQDLLGSIVAFCAVTAVSANPVAKKLPSTAQSKHLRPFLERRDESGYAQGQPIDGKGKGAPLSGKSEDSDLETGILTMEQAAPIRTSTSTTLRTSARNRPTRAP